MKKYKVAQIGTFDIENFGDLLFTDVLEFQLKDSCTIDLFSPIGGIKCFDTKEVYPISKLEEKCQQEKYDLIIVGGGDLIRSDEKIFITDKVYEVSSEPSLELWAYPIIISNRYQIPIAFNAVGTPMDFDFNEYHLIRALLNNVDYLSFRDSETMKTIDQLGIKNAVIVPDSVICISDIYDEELLNKIYKNLIHKNIVPKIEEYIVFQHNSTYINDDNYYSSLVKNLREISSERKILFMPIGYIHSDTETLSRLYNEKIPNIDIVDLDYKLTPLEMIAILNNSGGYIGTSMHGAVVSYSYGKPFLILNQMNSKKLYGFSQNSGNLQCCINNVNILSETFKNHFYNKKDETLNKNKAKIKDHFEKILKVLTEGKKTLNKKEFDFENIMKSYYSIKNKPLENIISTYHYSDESALNRRLLYWNKQNNGKCNIEIEVIPTKESILLYPCINTFAKVKNVIVDCNDVVYHGFIKMNDEYETINRFSYIEVSCSTKEKIKVEMELSYMNTEDFTLLYQEIGNSNDKKIDDLTKEKDNLIFAYEELKSKYFEVANK